MCNAVDLVLLTVGCFNVRCLLVDVETLCLRVRSFVVFTVNLDINVTLQLARSVSCHLDYFYLM